MTTAPQQYVIQIEHPDDALTLEKARALLEPLGVVFDPSYEPVLVNPKLGRFVVRGTATQETRAAAERLPGVRFFSDPRVSPAEQ